MAFKAIFQTMRAALAFCKRQRELGRSCTKPFRVFDGWAVRII